MSVSFIASIEAALGYHRFQDLPPNAPAKCKYGVILFNTANTAGYIPVAGTITGIARGIFFLHFLRTQGSSLTDEQRRFCRVQIIRAGVEICGLGIAYLVADILVTVERAQSRKAGLQQPKMPIQGCGPHHHS